MINEARLIGKELLGIKLVKEFEDLHKKLRKSRSLGNEEITQNFFLLNNNLSLQFDGLVCLFTDLINKNPEVNKIDGFKEFIEEKCAPLAIMSNLIIFILNNPINDDEIISIIETPYDHLFDKNIVKNESKLKKGFESILNTNFDTLFPLILNLRDNFFNSALYKSYNSALKTDGNIMKYKINIEALFYIIKQIIYQQIMDGQINFIDEDNIIDYNYSNSVEGNFFKISYQPSNNLNFFSATNIIEINYKNRSELGYIRSINNNFSQEKGFIINIIGEILSKDGLNMNSPINGKINEFLNKIGHWYKYIDSEYKSK